jgi:hypothetical protein
MKELFPRVAELSQQMSQIEAGIRKVMQRLCNSCFIAQLWVHNSVYRDRQTRF